jgi:hypothetical protein
MLLAALVSCVSVAAQTPSRPGPWVADVRGVTSPVPDDPVFFPELDSLAVIPARGFGLDVGAHVYVLNVGPSRLGLGANVIFVQATATPAAVSTTGSSATAVGQDVQVNLRLLAPQVSFNFGSRNGWSYLSAGLGTATTTTRTTGSLVARRDNEPARAINAGAGARWFLKSRMAFGFDVRMHRVSEGTAGPIERTPPVVTTPTAPATPAVLTVTPGFTTVVVSAGLSFR